MARGYFIVYCIHSHDSLPFSIAYNSFITITYAESHAQKQIKKHKKVSSVILTTAPPKFEKI